MGGKAILLVVLGFSIIFLIMEFNINSASTRTVENMTNYYINTNAHYAALSGANVAANSIFLNPNWSAGFNNIPFAGGSYSVYVEVLDTFKNIRRITALGKFRGKVDTVQVTLQPSKFSKFSYYSANEGENIWWTTGDTVWGPLHTQDIMNIDGHPVFMGKVTTKEGLNLNGYWTGKGKKKKFITSANPEFNGGFEQGIDLPMPSEGVSDLLSYASEDGAVFSGKDTVYLTFVNDSLKYKFHFNEKPTTVLTKNFTHNGVIFAQNAVLKIKGTVSGQITIGVSGSNGKGNVFIDDDIVYKNDPSKNLNSTDILGIVSENNVFVSDNAANNNGINIHATIFAQKGGFGAENYATRPKSGSINLLGGISQFVRLPVGTFSYSYGIISGFNKNYRYDNRMLFSSPPNFPNTGSFEIVSWYE